ncbi:MAG: tRNA (adenosine(37)-N6)-threonylcarbamoyltransferase complex dimerization subunit type 1 TsaB [Thermodesulfobacteriota bacterium]
MKKSTSKPSPPLILAIETASMCGSVAIVSGDKCLAENSIDSSSTHSKRLVQQVDYVMKETGLDWDQLDAIAISLGPGSFTGLRIGLSTAKGLVMATNLPLIGVPTLDGLASQAAAPNGSNICAVLDARKKEVYGAFYKSNNSGIPEKTGEYLVKKPNILALLIDKPTILIGDGAVLYRDVFEEIAADNAIFTPQQICFPRSAPIGFIAARMFAEKNFIDPAEAVPIYVRPSEAELTLKK